MHGLKILKVKIQLLEPDEEKGSDAIDGKVVSQIVECFGRKMKFVTILKKFNHVARTKLK